MGLVAGLTMVQRSVGKAVGVRICPIREGFGSLTTLSNSTIFRPPFLFRC